jgi:hypothetical protein
VARQRKTMIAMMGVIERLLSVAIAMRIYGVISSMRSCGKESDHTALIFRLNPPSSSNQLSDPSENTMCIAFDYFKYKQSIYVVQKC